MKNGSTRPTLVKLHAVGRVAGKHAMLGRIERRRELQVEQLVAPRRVALRADRERCVVKPPPPRSHAGSPEMQPVVAFKNLDAVGAQVQPDLATVVDHPADVPLQAIAVLILDRAELLSWVGHQFDSIALGDELPVDVSSSVGSRRPGLSRIDKGIRAFPIS